MDEFWDLVQSCRREAGDDTEKVEQLLLRRLRSMTPAGITTFEQRWYDEQLALGTWPVFDAATVFLGELDDEDFRSVRDWVISYGRATVQRVLADPDRIADLAADRRHARHGGFGELAAEAHIGLGGTPSELAGVLAGWLVGDDELTGQPADLTDEAATRRRFPRLTAYLDAHPWMPRPWGS